MENIKKIQVKYYHYLILSGVLWGFTPFIYKKTLLVTSIMGLLLFKYFIGTILLYVYDHKKYVKIVKTAWPTLFLFITFGTLIPSFLFPFGLSMTSALHASFISLSFPFFVYIFARIFLKDTIHKRVIFGSILASTGLLILLFGSDNSGNSSIIGDLVMLTSQMFAAFGVVFSRKLLVKKHVMPPEQLAFFEYIFAFFGYLVLTIIFSQIVYYNIQSSMSIIWLVLTASIAGSVPLLLYYRSVQHLPAERIPDINFISPLVGSLVAIFLLNESVTIVFVIGAIILLIGLLFSNDKLHPLIWGTHIHNKERSILNKIIDFEKSIITRI